MVILYMVLGKLSFVFDLLFGEVVGGEGLLQDGITHVLFVLKDAHDGVYRPFRFSHAPRHSLFHEPSGNNVWVDAVHVGLKNPAHYLGLLGVDDQPAILVLVIAVEAVRIDMHHTLFEKGANAPLTVL